MSIDRQGETEWFKKNDIWVNYAAFAAEKIVSLLYKLSLFTRIIVRMTAPWRPIAVASLTLFAVSAIGCMVSRPCNWDQWHYQSSDGRQRYHGNGDGSPPTMLDQQARAVPRRKSKPDGQQLAAATDKLPSKPKAAKSPDKAEVASVQWQEPTDSPAPPKRNENHRKVAASTEETKPQPAKPAKPAAPRARSEQQPQVAGAIDRTPFNWGFFGAETRW
jgi:hypothetical protein